MRSAGAVAVVLLGLLWLPSAAGAATFTVTRGDDPVPGACSPGDCSLREAVNAANASAAGDLVRLGARSHELSAASGGGLDVADQGALTLSGAGRARTAIDANGVDSVISVMDDARLTLHGVAVTGGLATNGGGVFTSPNANLTVIDARISGNAATNAGGGIQMSSPATLRLIRSAVSGNEAAGHGGGIALNSPSDSSLVDSTISGNTSGDTSAGNGGGIKFNSPATARFINTTISGNTAKMALTDGRGGGLSFNAPMDIELRSSTIAGNVAEGDGGSGGGIEAGTPTNIVSRNTILAGNTAATGANCNNPLISMGRNLESADTCGFNGSGDQTEVSPRLGALADNGGPNLTRALLEGSPALDRGTGCPSKDQRGAPRRRCDIGAYERVSCGGRLVNRVGTAGRDRLIGTKRSDGILGLAGNDRLIGRGGGDGLCGGKGRDRLIGGKGGDRLFGGGGGDRLLGGPGSDRLLGGGGRDLCLGGPGRDRAGSCERSGGIP